MTYVRRMFTFTEVLEQARDSNKPDTEQASDSQPPKRARPNDALRQDDHVANWVDDERTIELRKRLTEMEDEIKRQDKEMSQIMYEDDELLGFFRAKQVIAEEMVPFLAELYRIHSSKLQDRLKQLNGDPVVPPNTFDQEKVH